MTLFDIVDVVCPAGQELRQGRSHFQASVDKTSERRQKVIARRSRTTPSVEPDPI